MRRSALSGIGAAVPATLKLPLLVERAGDIECDRLREIVGNILHMDVERRRRSTLARRGVLSSSTRAEVFSSAIELTLYFHDGPGGGPFAGARLSRFAPLHVLRFFPRRRRATRRRRGEVLRTSDARLNSPWRPRRTNRFIAIGADLADDRLMRREVDLLDRDRRESSIGSESRASGHPPSDYRSIIFAGST